MLESTGQISIGNAAAGNNRSILAELDIAQSAGMNISLNDARLRELAERPAVNSRISFSHFRGRSSRIAIITVVAPNDIPQAGINIMNTRPFILIIQEGSNPNTVIDRETLLETQAHRNNCQAILILVTGTIVPLGGNGGNASASWTSARANNGGNGRAFSGIRHNQILNNSNRNTRQVYYVILSTGRVNGSSGGGAGAAAYGRQRLMRDYVVAAGGGGGWPMGSGGSATATRNNGWHTRSEHDGPNASLTSGGGSVGNNHTNTGAFGAITQAIAYGGSGGGRPTDRFGPGMNGNRSSANSRGSNSDDDVGNGGSAGGCVFVTTDDARSASEFTICETMDLTHQQIVDNLTEDRDWRPS